LIAKGIYTIFLFLCETTEEYEQWTKNLERYVLQSTPILEQYDFNDKLGLGTFGYVFLAEEKENPSSSFKISVHNVENGSNSMAQDISAGDGEESKHQPCLKVAIKVIKKEKVMESKQGIEFLTNEIRVHWALEQCVSVLTLLKIYED
jgi:serine/threonine protein kinase